MFNQLFLQTKYINTFIAYSFDKDICNKIEELQEKINLDRSCNVKFSSRNKFHITIKYIGETDLSLLNSLEKKMRQCSENISPFEIEIADRVGVFPDYNFPKVIWLNVRDKANNFSWMNKFFSNQLLNEKVELQKYVPHITLFRLNKNTLNKEKKAELKKIVFSGIKLKVDKIILFQTVHGFYKKLVEVCL